MKEMNDPVLDVTASKGINGGCKSQQQEGPVEIPEPCVICESGGVTQNQWIHQTEEKNTVNAFKYSFEKRQMPSFEKIEHRYPEKNNADPKRAEI
jgi:hypothetical protein